MTRIIVLQHVPYEILGTMDPLLKEQRVRIKYVNFGRHPDSRPSLEGYDGMVILGGPMNVDQIDHHPHLKTEIEIIREAMALGLPMLGICLGSQLIAKAAGATVKKNHCKEIGWYDVSPTEHASNDPLLKHLEKTEKIFQWHGDTFELPEDAILLAKGESCVNQAFRLGESIYGFQFHLEVDEPLINRWLTVPQHQAELESVKDKIDPDVIRAKTPQYINRLNELGNKVFLAFCKLLGKPHPAVKMPSR